MNFKPMLAADASAFDLNKIRWPMLISPKLDGLRCILWEGVAYSRNAKPFRNRFVQEWAKDYHNLDGELIVGSPTHEDCLNISKAVTAFEGEPDFGFYLFDCIEGVDPRFKERQLHVYGEHFGQPRIQLVPQVECRSVLSFQTAEERWVGEGYEGVMGRHPTGPYKHGRSTMSEQFLWKHKRFTDGEATVLRLEEGHTNTNTLQKDELGRAKRSFTKDGLVGNGMVGTLICMDPVWGEIRVAPGKMSHYDRSMYWNLYKSSPHHVLGLVGKIIHWRSFGYGTKDAPRFARYYGLREDGI